LREETTDLAPDLFDGDSTRSLSIREELGEIGYVPLATISGILTEEILLYVIALFPML
jgi:hypothetical protein